jgi:hypothetical protein
MKTCIVRVLGSGFWVQGSGFRVQGLPADALWRVQDNKFLIRQTTKADKPYAVHRRIKVI